MQCIANMQCVMPNAIMPSANSIFFILMKFRIVGSCSGKSRDKKGGDKKVKDTGDTEEGSMWWRRTS